MNAKLETTPGSLANTAKLVLAVLVLTGAIVAYYWFDQVAGAIRAVGLIVAVGVSLLVASFTAQGRAARHFLSESQFELRKVVWPTRQETIQTTLVISLVVMIVSIVLWLIDMLLGWVILDQLLKSGG
jgi:preprotein translocase subunit SecE